MKSKPEKIQTRLIRAAYHARMARYEIDLLRNIYEEKENLDHIHLISSEIRMCEMRIEKQLNQT